MIKRLTFYSGCSILFMKATNTEDIMLDQLIDTYNTWIEAQGLPAMSADELAWEDCVNAEQRKWLLAFGKEWEAVEEML